MGKYKKINVSTNRFPNKFTIVDRDNFEWLNQWKWGLSTKGYVVRKENKKNITMSRLINKTPEGYQTDHINRNKLDNRKKNLRTVTNKINHRNKNKQKNNTSNHVGVYKETFTGKWRVQIGLDNKLIRLGRFTKLADAVKARKEAEKKLWISQ